MKNISVIMISPFIFLFFMAACSGKGEQEQARIYLSDDRTQVLADVSGNKEIQILAEKGSIYTLLQQSGDGNWIILEKAPELTEGRAETTHVLVSRKELKPSLFETIDPQLSQIILNIDDSHGESFLELFLTAADDPLLISLAGASLDSIGKEITLALNENREHDLAPVVFIPKPFVMEGNVFLLKPDGILYAAGKNRYGQMGNGTTDKIRNPAPIPGLENVISVATGGDFILAASDDGTVRVWGRNENSSLGNGTKSESRVPVKLAGLSDIVSVAAGSNHGLALSKEGAVWAWGANNWGQVGDGTTEERLLPVRIDIPEEITAISAGRGHSLALSTGGTVWAWGRNDSNQLGNGTLEHSPVPVRVLAEDGESFIDDIVSIAAGGSYVGGSAAIHGSGDVFLWGDNDDGQLANGSREKFNGTYRADKLAGAVSIAIGGQHVLALMQDGTVLGWGYNWNHQLGSDTDGEHRLFPVKVPGLSGIVDIHTKADTCMAADYSGQVWIWGDLPEIALTRLPDAAPYQPDMIAIQ